MRAVVCTSFGSPPVLQTVPEVTPGPRQVRIRQLSSAISAGDWLISQGRPWVFRPVFSMMLRPGPPILGLDVSGVIDAVGEEVTGWAPGDRVIGEHAHAWAEHTLADPATLARIPDGVDPLLAGTLPVSGITALQGLRDAGAVQPGERVLINGASGGVGHFAVQIARILGAEVTGVCSAAKAARVRALGAEAVLDYRTEAFTDRKGEWDVIFDLAGSAPVAACLGALRPGGRYVASAGHNGGPLLGPLPRILAVALRGLVDRRVKMHTVSPSAEDLSTLLGWVAAGSLRPHLERVVPLAGAPGGLQALGAGEVTGKIAVQIAQQ